MASLSSADLDDLQAFLKDWLRHTGRTQADLRRALQASSIRMPVLLEALERTHSQQGLAGLAEDAGEGGRALGLDLSDSLGQLDLLLQEIRQDQQP
jgi:hypothetical protein